MSTINDISIRTPLAAVANGAHIRVYQLAVDGGVRETLYEGGWTGGQAENTIGTVRLNSPLAATALALDHIRVYGIDNDSTLKEFAYDADQGWYLGGLTGQFSVAPYSAVAAVFLANKTKLRVYAQLPDNTIQEYSWDGNGWYKDQNLGQALPGTSIAATSWGESEDSISIRVYFQDTDKNVIEKGHDPNSSGWYTGYLSFKNDVTRASLAAVSWGGPHVRLYYTAPDGCIREKVSGGHWSDGQFVQPALPASSVAAITIGGPQLRIYLQNGTDNTAVTEFIPSGDGGVVGYQALPPA
ncbi:hypothetical protein VTI74DRAFT_8688 [Chaetomium olivicolor]